MAAAKEHARLHRLTRNIDYRVGSAGVTFLLYFILHLINVLLLYRDRATATVRWGRRII